MSRQMVAMQSLQQTPQQQQKQQRRQDRLWDRQRMSRQGPAQQQHLRPMQMRTQPRTSRLQQHRL
jgi:hypothetical protein